MNEQQQSGISWNEAVRTWGRVAALSFGGPAGQIAVMHKIIVEEKKWIDEERFLRALNFCMLLPGPEAQQLATYIGWLTKGLRGAFVAGGLFILPGFLAILALSLIYVLAQDHPLVTAIFYGLKPAVLIIVVEALLRISKRILKNNFMVAIAALSLLAIHVFKVPFPAVILCAGLIGYWGSRIAPQWFLVKTLPATTPNPDENTNAAPPALPWYAPSPTLRWIVVVSSVALPLWFGPLFVIALTAGTDSIFFHQGKFFSQAAVVTFGGAYSVLTYVAQQGVEHFHWLTGPQMLDGLGMAETTPGPLIMVVQFVAFMGAYQQAGAMSPLLAGVLASVLTTWVTFVPCFYFVLAGAPFVERLAKHSSLSGALSLITAAVVGSVLNLAAWFSIQVLFLKTWNWTYGPVQLLLPDTTTPDVLACAISLLAGWLTFRLHLPMHKTLLICSAIGALGRILMA